MLHVTKKKLCAAGASTKQQQLGMSLGCSSAELSLNTTFNAKHFTESVPTHCFNFEGISLTQNLASMHVQITALRYMGINSTCTIYFTQLAFKGSELKAHLCC